VTARHDQAAAAEHGARAQNRADIMGVGDLVEDDERAAFAGSDYEILKTRLGEGVAN